MRALVFDQALRFENDYPEPSPQPEKEVVVRVVKAGICRTDLEIVRGYMGFKGVPGHEFVAVVQGGEWDGRRIASEINVACGSCEMCLKGTPSQCLRRTTLGIDRHDGAFAQHIAVPVKNLHAIPDEVTDDQAVFVEPLAAALQTLEQTHIRPGDRVILIGAGKLGLLVAQVVSLTGCSLTVIARHARAHNLLRTWGIDSVEPSSLPARSADIVIDCTGTAEGFAAALEVVKPRGVVHLKSTYQGLPQADLTRVVVDEVQVVSSRCGPFDAALNLLKRRLVDVDSLVDMHYPLEAGTEAFEKAGQKGMLKVMLDIS
jgi:threonine dehydrogenase-like Zn-dependent dehydrogenase